MSVTTYTQPPSAKLGALLATGFSRLFRRVIEAREKQMASRVAMILNSYGDAQLKSYGYTSAGIARLRQGNSLEAVAGQASQARSGS